MIILQRMAVNYPIMGLEQLYADDYTDKEIAAHLH